MGTKTQSLLHSLTNITQLAFITLVPSIPCAVTLSGSIASHLICVAPKTPTYSF